MCYSYRDRQMDQEIRRTLREREERRRRKQQKKERAADKDRKLARA